MGKIDSYLSKKFICSEIGIVKVIDKVIGSRTKLIVREIDRGPGYNKLKKTYTGVKLINGWYRGENYDFGKTHKVHSNNLKIMLKNIS